MSLRNKNNTRNKIKSFTSEINSILALSKNRISLENLIRDYEILTEKKLENVMHELDLNSYSKMISMCGLTSRGSYIFKAAGTSHLEEAILKTRKRQKKKKKSK